MAPFVGKGMRRKNVIVTLGLILMMVLLHGLGIPLRQSRLAEPAEAASSQNICGQVVRIERRQAGGCRFEVCVKTIDGQHVNGRERILVTCKQELRQPWELLYETVSFQAELEQPQGRRNPGCFDYRLYLMSRGIFYIASVKGLPLRQEGSLNQLERFQRFLMMKRYQFEDTLSETSRGLICGILFGDTTSMEEEIYQQFRNNGTAHILAVSGLHIGILYGIYQKLMGKKRSLPAMALLALLLFSYGTISLWSPSVSRAAAMILLRLLAQAMDLRYDRLTGLSTVALLFMLRNPYIIFSAGFQMSFLAIASITFLQPVMPKRLPEGLAMVVSVNLGLLVYQMYQFNYVSLVSLFANIPIVYLAGILLPVSLGCFLLFIFLGSCGVLNLIMDSLSFLLVEINRLSTLGGCGSVDVVSPPLWMVVGAYLLLFFMASEQRLIMKLRDEKKRLRIYFAGCVLIALVIGGLWYCPVSDDDIVFVDVGQGDCIHIRDGNNNILIDGGGSSTYNVGKNTLKPYLLKNGVWNVDLAIATHLHMDHYQGLVELEETYPVKEIRTGMIYGDQVQVSQRVWIETMWPLSIEGENGQDENHQCSVFMVHYDGWKVLITGDLDQEGEMQMLEFYKAQGSLNRLKADILKVGHHGSKTSTCDEFLAVVDPDVAVIQVGVYNIYGHPDAKIIEKCLKKDIIVRRNDKNGGIGIHFSGKNDGEGSYVVDTVMEDV